MNETEKLKALSRAGNLIQDGVNIAYDVLAESCASDIGIGFADTTASEIRRYLMIKSGWEQKFSNPKPASGYLLEFYDEANGAWQESEFCIVGLKTNIWSLKEECDEFREHEVMVGFYSDLDNGVWSEDFDDWDFRLGVEADLSKPTPSGYWGGVSTVDGRLYRVSERTISGVMSEKAKSFFSKYPYCTWEV